MWKIFRARFYIGLVLKSCSFPSSPIPSPRKKKNEKPSTTFQETEVFTWRFARSHYRLQGKRSNPAVILSPSSEVINRKTGNEVSENIEGPSYGRASFPFNTLFYAPKLKESFNLCTHSKSLVK